VKDIATGAFPPGMLTIFKSIESKRLWKARFPTRLQIKLTSNSAGRSRLGCSAESSLRGALSRPAKSSAAPSMIWAN